MQQGGRAAPMGLDIPPWATKQLQALSPGDTTAGPIFPHGAEAAARASVNPSADPEHVSPTWSSAEVSIAAMPMASTPSIAATIAALSEVPGVESVEVNVQAHLMRKKKFSSAARSLQEVVSIAAMCPAVKPKNGPDTDTGKYSESPPYGVRMVQADHPEMVSVSKEYAHKVIFCVIDTGLDRKNGEFSTSREC
jgi:copper chaperone CopZ